MNLILYEIEFNGTISLQTSIRNYLYKGIDCIKTLLVRFQPLSSIPFSNIMVVEQTVE